MNFFLFDIWENFLIGGMIFHDFDEIYEFIGNLHKMKYLILIR